MNTQGNRGDRRRRESGSGQGGRSASGKPARSSAGRSGQPGKNGQNTGGASKGRGTRAGGFPSGGKGRPAAGKRRHTPKTAPRQQTPAVDVHDPDGVRLQKLLAGAGVGSRRTCELLIAAGRVDVDGQTVTELGVRVDPLRQVVRVDGERIQLDPSRVYLALNKPLGVVSTMNDELGRPCIGDLVQGRNERLFHVGRLDSDTDGLLLLTNDGELANRLQHPSYGVPKTYIATVPGPVGRDVGRTLRAGVELEDGVVAVDSFRLIDSLPGKAIVEVVLHEGKKHIVRRLLEAVGHPVLTLTRTNVGPVRIGDLKTGRMRPLNGKEIAALYTAAGL
ncbi:23S rRNA pseudouridine2605 synthase [Austwickia chelonae]|uniref:Pseudouridine synthase n=1 Tax=Austwickia chelonae NBRC 105200 TaxID=1184607 RepID=K6W6Q1_9MICO|nr:pseudouridine synthase [Austwickia chelonae]GAB77487.1 putative pseudouridine synthase [Austwickia chelonae NBRC 105200]SEW11380.1 23S rRNA pseudouridine2605 synthase [Austwickia chelonae]